MKIPFSDLAEIVRKTDASLKYLEGDKKWEIIVGGNTMNGTIIGRQTVLFNIHFV